MSQFRVALATLVLPVVAACSGNGGQPTTLPDERVTFYAAGAGDQAAAVVAGDFNGDGFTDVALGAGYGDGPDNDREDAGEAYLFFGPFEAASSRDAGAGEADVVIYGAAADDNLARALAVGDFNNDGVSDLAVGAPQAADSTGRVYVFFGGEWPRQIDLSTSDPDVTIDGVDPLDFAGLMLAAGDLDADGASDLLIGALMADGPNNTREDAGEVYAVLGADMAGRSHIGLAHWPRTVYGARPGDRLGEALAAGDIDGDGADDLILAAPFAPGADSGRRAAGETYVLTAVPQEPIDMADAVPFLTVIGVDEGDQLGHALGIGDVDGDGRSDLWLGAVSADGPQNTVDLAGEAALVLSNGRAVVDVGAGEADALIYGPEAEARLGRSATAGDVDGDGLADLVISAPNLSRRAGHVYIFFARDPYPASAADAGRTLIGLDAGDVLGHEAFGGPPLGFVDLNSSGETYLLVSAANGDGPNNDRTDCGEAYLIPAAALAP